MLSSVSVFVYERAKVEKNGYSKKSVNSEYMAVMRCNHSEIPKSILNAKKTPLKRGAFIFRAYCKLVFCRQVSFN